MLPFGAAFRASSSFRLRSINALQPLSLRKRGYLWFGGHSGQAACDGEGRHRGGARGRAGSEDASASAVTPDKLLETAKADTGTDFPGGMSAHCPQVVAWPRDRLLTIYPPGPSGGAA